jgi:hypothetical protein
MTKKMQDEFYQLRQWFIAPGKGICAAGVREECARIRAAWSAAVFSDGNDQSVRRYFHYHLKGISEIADTLFVCQGNLRQCDSLFVQEQLSGLIDHMRHYYGQYFNPAVVAPAAYTRPCLSAVLTECDRLKGQLEDARINQSVRELLLSYITEMTRDDPDVRFSFGSLFYFVNWIKQLAVIPLHEGNAENELNDRLERLNFNRLDYFLYRQGHIRAQLAVQADPLSFLQLEKCNIMSLPVANAMVYHPDWPPLKNMIVNWLEEEILCLDANRMRVAVTAEVAVIEKLQLNLSVAQLAFIIRLFNEQSFFVSANLTDIFRFVSRHFQTKRQPVISAGSLSKEYYGTDQITAAGLRGALQQMLGSLNKRFFPVWLVIGATGVFC